MFATSRRSILLYNHATGTGHHESWTAMFATMLLERGFRVACITPDPDALEGILRSRGVAANQDLHLMAMPPVTPPPPTILRRLKSLTGYIAGPSASKGNPSQVISETSQGKWRPTLLDRWKINAHRYAYNQPEVQITPDLQWPVRLKRRLLFACVPPVWHTGQFLKPLLRVFYDPAPQTGSRHPLNLALAAETALAGLPWRPELLVSMYVDLWMTNPSAWSKPAVQMPLPWVGIRFMPLTGHHIGTEGYFRDAQFKGLCFLDEEAVVRYQARHPERTFEFLPDVANGGLPDGPSPLVDEIRERAAGRRIVLLCGSIEGRKNIRLFCETANLLKEESLFFAIVGQLQPTSLSREEKVLINEFSGNFKGNSLFRDIFFEDEREMNAIIQAADIIFAVYRDFPISSNLLSKASMFKKPIVVSDRFLMGRRTRQYGIGLAVSEHDATALAKALNLLAKTPLAEGIYSRFCEEISVPVLGKRLDGFLRKCIESGNQ